MALVALDGTPLVAVGAANREGITGVAALTTTLADAANEAVIFVGRIFTEDGGSHTIDTTGSSSLGWRAASVTFANAGTTVKVGLAAVDATSGPPARAAAASDVITFDVSKSLTGGGGGITATAWQEHVPDSGTKTIANGDLVAFAVQMTARGGADAVNIGHVSSLTLNISPSVTSYTGGSYSDATKLPNVVITFSDGKLGFFYGGFVASVGSTGQTWNSGSATKEYGNLLQFPVPVNAYGIIANGSFGGDTDVILYSDPLGTPAAQKTISTDLNVLGTVNTGGVLVGLFPAPYSLAANTPYGVIYKPTTATDISVLYKTLNASAHQKSETLGTNGYAINRASGAFAAQNSSLDRFPIGLLVGAFDAGGTAGASRARVASGF